MIMVMFMTMFLMMMTPSLQVCLGRGEMERGKYRGMGRSGSTWWWWWCISLILNVNYISRFWKVCFLDSKSAFLRFKMCISQILRALFTDINDAFLKYALLWWWLVMMMMMVGMEVMEILGEGIWIGKYQRRVLWSHDLKKSECDPVSIFLVEWLNIFFNFINCLVNVENGWGGQF